MSRRGFLGATGAFGAAALVPTRVRALTQEATGEVRAEVAVVGSGLAGLAAGSALHDAGVDIVLLEAGDRAGGRIAPVDAPPGLSDVVVPETHEALLGMARQVGLATTREGTAGDSVLIVGGERRLVPPGSLCGDQDLDREVGVALQRLNLMAAEVDPNAPWGAVNAGERDRIALGSWVADNVAAEHGQAVFTIIARAVWAAEPSEISLLHALATIAGAGGSGPLINATLAPEWAGPMLVPANEVGEATCRACHSDDRPWSSVPRAPEPVAYRRLDGGAVALAEQVGLGLADHLRSASPVRRIADDGNGVSVEGDGFVVRADRAIVALPPAAAAQVVMDPPLPAGHRAFLRLSGGDVASAVVTGVGASWQAEGLSGRAAGTGGLTLGRGLASRTGDLMVVHACGAAAREWSKLAEAERAALVRERLSAWFGSASSGPGELLWQRDWRGGDGGGTGWSVVVPPGGVTSTLRAAVEPHGRVYWAGTERARGWAGWLEGAVRSGEQAAGQVLDARGGAETGAEEMIL